MIKKKIRALKSVSINTRLQVKSLNKSEIATMQFENERQFKSLLSLGNFEEVTKKIPVVGRKASSNAVPEVVKTAIATSSESPNADVKGVKTIEEKAPSSKEEEDLVCKICGRNFKTKRGLTMHVKRTHGKKEENKVDETELGREVKRICPNCVTTMVVEGTETSANGSLLIKWICPICGEKIKAVQSE